MVYPVQGSIVALLLTTLVCAAEEAASVPPALPKHIYTFWEGPLPSLVQYTTATWSRWAPDWTVHFLNRTSAFQLLPGVGHDGTGLCEGWKKLAPAHFADLLRLEILSLHGGVWLDMTVGMTTSFDMLVTPMLSGDALVGLELDFAAVEHRRVSPSGPDWAAHFRPDGSPLQRLKDAGDPKAVYFENWFFAAPLGCPVLQLWRDEYRRAVSGDGGLEGYTERLLADPLSKDYLHSSLSKWLPYLTQHAALAKVRHDHPELRVKAARAEDKAFAHLDYAVDWTAIFLQHPVDYASDGCGGVVFALGRGPHEEPAPPHPGPLIKLRSLERPAFDRILFYAAYAEDSPLAEVFELPRAPLLWPRKTMRCWAIFESRFGMDASTHPALIALFAPSRFLATLLFGLLLGIEYPAVWLAMSFGLTVVWTWRTLTKRRPKDA